MQSERTPQSEQTLQPERTPQTVVCKDVNSIDVVSLRRILSRFQEALEAHRTRIDALNVYPVPDGDTGTNMFCTLREVVAQMSAANDDMASVCKAIAYGALIGSRGNSGVIMAQILRGLAQVLSEASEAEADDASEANDYVDVPLECVDGSLLARALTSASKDAYNAVGNPVEGTILTVMRELAEGAQNAVANGGQLVDVLDAAHKHGYDALERTPTMLHVLAEAGVVDAGGTGLMLLIDACREQLFGHPMPVPHPVPHVSVASNSITEPSSGAPGLSQGTRQTKRTACGDGSEAVDTANAVDTAKTVRSIADLQYEVMFLLEADDTKIEGFKKAWAKIGDSIVVIGGDGTWNCHIHTDHIGAAIEAGIEVGRPYRIEVTYLLEHSGEEDWVNSHLQTHTPETSKPSHTTPIAAPSHVAAPAPTTHPQVSPRTTPITSPSLCSVVSVCEGEGLYAIFASMGACVASGGQSMNPSTAELLEVVETVPTGHVVVLPNNSNIIAVAEQLDALTNRSVAVVHTKSVIAGLSAMMGFNVERDSESNKASMSDAARCVVVGEVTQAVRSSASAKGSIAEGDWLGIAASGIAVITHDEVTAAVKLLDELITDEHELLTVVTGIEAQDDAIAAIEEHVRAHYADIEIEVKYGGQSLYPYYLGLE